MSESLNGHRAVTSGPELFDKYSWASAYIAALASGSQVTFTAYGRSMEPFILNGSEVTVEPIPETDVIACGTIVLVVLETGEQYLHAVSNVLDNGRFEIRGLRAKKPDGVVGRSNIKGRLLHHRAPEGETTC